MRDVYAYLEAVLTSRVIGDWPALFRLRGRMLDREREDSGFLRLAPSAAPPGAGPGSGVDAEARAGADDTGTTAEGPRRFISLEEVNATLKELESQLFTLPFETVEERLFDLTGHTDLHTGWWRRLRAINNARPVLKQLAFQNEQWANLVGRISAIVVLPQTQREPARLRFLNELEPVLSPHGVRVQERYQLVQVYGNRDQISIFATRLLMDAPAFFEIEKPFLQNLQPDLSGSMVALKRSPTQARSRYVPVNLPKPSENRHWHLAAAFALFLWVVWRWS